MLQSVLTPAAMSGSGSSSSTALPRPAGDLDLGHQDAAMLQQAKQGKKSKPVAMNQAKTKINLADINLQEIADLKDELEEKPDAEMPLFYHSRAPYPKAQRPKACCIWEPLEDPSCIFVY